MARSQLFYSKTLLLVVTVVASTVAAALDFACVAETGTLLYAEPSLQSTKRYIVSRFTPFEVVIDKGDWLKIRDRNGLLAWVEKKRLTEKRTVMVVSARAQIRTRADAASPVQYEVMRDVALELLDKPVGGWVKVKHPEEKTSGFVRITDVWGL